MSETRNKARAVTPIQLPQATHDEILLRRYRVLERRGHGGFGTVCTCWDTRLQRRVAIKRLPLAVEWGTTAEEALAEARTACMLNHPNIVTVYDFETDGAFAYLVMEHVDGLNLEELLARVEGGRLTPEECALILRSVASALSFAHENRVLHLDIKPTNIMVDRQGTVKLADFGMSTLASAAGYGGARGGTVGYMPPEQIMGEMVDERTDVFALATVVWQALTGTSPFLARSAEDSQKKIERGPERLQKSCPGLDPAVEQELLAALSPSPGLRPADVLELSDSLVPLLGDTADGARSLRELVVQAEDDEDESNDIRRPEEPLARLGLPETIAADGPTGFVNFVSGENVYGTVAYASEYVVGSTWNVDLARRYGECVGEEGAYGKQNFDPYVPYSGWYAPGLNLHRSPFGGRNSEYYSEDPYLSGMLAAAQIEGAQSRGLITFMKHFALNEQETHRDDNGLCTWATEQAIRELYLRPFEIAVKKASPKGIMTSFNRIGTRWTGGDYRLVTEILRGEWGFVGTVICDFNVSSYMNAKQMIYAGGDLNLTTTRPWMTASEENSADVAMLRRAAHNVLYSVVNSNAMNGVTKDTVFRVAMPLWQAWLIAVECVVAAGIATWGVFETLRLRRALASGKEPEAGMPEGT